VRIANPVARVASVRLFATMTFCILQTRVIVRVPKINAAMIHCQFCAKA
jgi:hypothetical protein